MKIQEYKKQHEQDKNRTFAKMVIPRSRSWSLLSITLIPILEGQHIANAEQRTTTRLRDQFSCCDRFE